MNKLEKMYLEYNPDKDKSGSIGIAIADKFYHKRAIPKRKETLEFKEKHRKILEEIASNNL